MLVAPVGNESNTMNARLRRYSEYFHPAFRRRDQARWLEAYLHGLLSEAGRKNVEGIARELDGFYMAGVTDVAQALQNFVNQSPWDEELLWARLRKNLLAETQGTILLVDEVGSVKQGRHSVGVHRQYCGDGGRKTNCQVAVTLFAEISGTAFPVASQLYLPRSWTRDPRRLSESGVPEEFQEPRSRSDIALHLLEQCREQHGGTALVVASDRYGGQQDFRHGLLKQDCHFMLEVPCDTPLIDLRTTEVRPAIELIAQLSAQDAGVDVALTELDRSQFPFRLHSSAEGHPLLVRLPGATSGQVMSTWRRRLRVAPAIRQLESLGLQHFEGRSWRGFHHHFCLVCLAYAFSHSLRQVD